VSSSTAKRSPHAIDRHVGNRVRMRRKMQGMSQEKLGEALGLTCQQVQKYEKGTNRIAAGRLQHIASIQQVPISFFFEGAPGLSYVSDESSGYVSDFLVSDFLATSEGLALTKAYKEIQNAKLRRSIVDLVKQIAGEDEPNRSRCGSFDRGLTLPGISAAIHTRTPG
jgi:transcriptional regulator with XRE-family HTH domain